MKRLPAQVFALFFACLSAACSNKNDSPGPGEFLFDSGTSDGAHDSTPFDGGPSLDSSVVDGTGSDTFVEGGGPPSCPGGFVDGPTTAVGYTHGTNELLAAITWDELTMAWTTEDADGVTIHYSDRAAHDDAFGTNMVLSSSLGPFARDKVALSADGLTLLYVSEDGTKVHQLTRTARGVTFDETSRTSAPFVKITGPTGEGSSVDKTLADLVLSRDGKWLFYTDLDRTSGPTIMLSVRLADGTWDYPNPIDNERLAIESGFRKRPTGISADARTLFFWDEASESTSVAVRGFDTALFDEIYGYVPTGRRAMPTESCARVYLSVEIADKPDAGADAARPKSYSIVHAP